MIHEVGVELGTQLVRQKCPFPVVDLPEPTQDAAWRERVVIGPADGGDAFDAVVGAHIHPKHHATRQLAVTVTIYAASPRSGAYPWEHRRRVDRVLDCVVIGLRNVLATRKNRLQVKSGKYVTPKDLQGAEIPSGAGYELTIMVDRAIMELDFAGNARPVRTIGGKPGPNQTPVGISGTPALTFARSGQTISRDTGSWVADGFVVGQKARIRGTVANNVLATVTAITDSVLTMSPNDLEDEGPVTGVTIMTAISSNTLSVWFAGDNDPADAEVA